MSTAGLIRGSNKVLFMAPRAIPPVKLYYRIGEVADVVGVEPHVLRYWESEFGTIRPQKSPKGQRVYSRKDLEKLLKVKELLYGQGYTIAGAKKRLREVGSSGSITPLAAQPELEAGNESTVSTTREVGVLREAPSQPKLTRAHELPSDEGAKPMSPASAPRAGAAASATSTNQSGIARSLLGVATNATAARMTRPETSSNDGAHVTGASSVGVSATVVPSAVKPHATPRFSLESFDAVHGEDVAPERSLHEAPAAVFEQPAASVWSLLVDEDAGASEGSESAEMFGVGGAARSALSGAAREPGGPADTTRQGAFGAASVSSLDGLMPAATRAGLLTLRSKIAGELGRLGTGAEKWK